jgi:hypothetical protein
MRRRQLGLLRCALAHKPETGPTSLEKMAAKSQKKKSEKTAGTAAEQSRS